MNPENQSPTQSGGIEAAQRGKPSLILAFAVLVALFSLTSYFARAYRAERQDRAGQHFQAGLALSGQGRYQRALDQYRAALSFSREQPEHRLELAQTLVRIGRVEEAEAHLRELQQSNPAGAPVNLMLARIAAQRADTASAEAYYHRAIYGLWPENPRESRLKTRLELVDLLVSAGAVTRAEAELLSLADELPEDSALRRRVGGLFLRVGAPSQAADLFRTVIRQNSRDGEAHAGLGAAEFDMGRYLSARTAYHNALRVGGPEDQIRQRLDVINEILILDPTQRGLSTRERHRRSVELVRRSLQALEDCLEKSGRMLAPQSQLEYEDALKLLKTGAGVRPSSEKVDMNISLAERLWLTHGELCSAKQEGTDQALALLLQRLLG